MSTKISNYVNLKSISAIGIALIALISAANVDLSMLHDRESSQVVSNSPALAINDTGGTKVKAGATFAALADGTAVAVTSGTVFPALSGTIAAAKYGVWAFYVDSAGTITVSSKSADVATSGGLTAALAAKASVPADKAEIGFIVVTGGAAAAFTGGTTALSAGTTTYFSNLGRPDVPSALTLIP
jgi:hypothetical protein